MEELEGKIQAIETAFVPPSVQVWDALERADRRAREETGNPLLADRERATLQAYLTTEKTQPELKSIAGLRSKTGVHNLIHRSMQTVYDSPFLPEDIRQEYQTPEQAIQSRSSIMTPTSLRRRGERIREGWQVEKPDRQTGKSNKGKKYNIQRGPDGKKEFSATHKQHLTEGNLRRWQQHREQQAQNMAPEHTVVDFSQPSQPPQK